MEVFKRTNSIEVNLGDLTMKEIMDYPKWNIFNLEEFYLAEVFNSNHVQIRVVKGSSKRNFTRGIHDFEYNVKSRKIKIYSRYKYNAFLVYGYLLALVIPLILTKNKDEALLFTILIVCLFLFITLLLVLQIKSESKEIEREMILRINYIQKKNSDNNRFYKKQKL